MESNIEVSILCLTYNQGRYIRSAIEGFLMQKTDFNYEIVIHDDASTDNTRDIIDEYSGKYPDKIIRLYEKENQFSKDNVAMEMYFPKCRGKYIAYCEGDDYWIDSRKLQIQYDFMEHHKDVNLCGHNNIMLKSDGSIQCSNMDEGYIGINTILDVWQTGGNRELPRPLSIMFRKKLFDGSLPEFMEITHQSGDITKYIYMASVGELYVMSNIMGVYRCNATGSYTQRINQDNSYLTQTLVKNQKVLESIRKYLPSTYTEKIDELINQNEYKVDLAEKKYRLALNSKYKVCFKNEKNKDRLFIFLHAIVNK